MQVVSFRVFPSSRISMYPRKQLVKATGTQHVAHDREKNDVKNVDISKKNKWQEKKK